jgi:hypothetical protein
MYANDAQTSLPSICVEAGTMGNLGGETFLGYVPFSMEQAQQYFYNGGYNTDLDVDVDETGVMTIGIKKDNFISNDWTIFTNFRLTYLGNPTGISNSHSALDAEPSLTANRSPLTAPVFRIDGTRVDAIGQPGIYVANGKKIMK